MSIYIIFKKRKIIFDARRKKLEIFFCNKVSRKKIFLLFKKVAGLSKKKKK